MSLALWTLIAVVVVGMLLFNEPTNRQNLCSIGLGLGAGGAQQPYAEGHDQAAVFRQRDELVGRHGAELRMAPTKQGLGAPHRGLRPQAADRLQVQGHVGVGRLVEFDGLAQGVAQDAVDHAEQRRVRSNPERQRQHGPAWDDTVQCIDIDNANKVLLDPYAKAIGRDIATRPTKI